MTALTLQRHLSPIILILSASKVLFYSELQRGVIGLSASSTNKV